jgi:sugar/nucleoside kinase (ribokinase family)
VKPVICIGAAVLDLIALIDEPLDRDGRIPALEARLGAGGLAATAAVALARLGVPTSIIGTVGDDDASRLIREGLEREGVDTRWLRSVPGRPMMSVALVDRATAHRGIASFDPGHGMPALDEAVLEAAGQAAWLHVDHLGLATLARLRQAGVSTPASMDHGIPAPGLELRELTLYAPTEARLRERYPRLQLLAAVRAALDEGPAIVAVTRGVEGSVAGYRTAVDEEPAYVQVPASEVEVVSTLGAGDVFHGALLAALVRGLDVPDALAHANAAAALSCRALDGRSAIPTWSELRSFMASARPLASS